ncbi:MAG: GNAT family N-acetyltransferase [Gammaproteobacteria bacterium]|nr:GNAT family N-acetyltransferase [Gammaproteobacteria bacterium]
MSYNELIRNVEIYRPYPDEVPWDLLETTESAEADLAAVLELDFLRVAKLHGTAAGAYGIRPLTAIRYELVVLVVAEPYRRRGLGRWLLGHAIGLAETKGGREIVARGTAARGAPAQRLLGAVGFAPQGSDLLLRLTPE